MEKQQLHLQLLEWGFCRHLLLLLVVAVNTQATPSITISGPQSGINTATATANMADTYYTINSATPIVSGITTLTLAENLINTVGVGSTAYLLPTK